MSGYSHSFDPSKYNFEKGDFDPERDTARPTFYMQEEFDPITKQLVQVEMIRIQGPGEALNVYGGKVRDIDRRRFAKQYDAFKRGETILDGTPLSKWAETANNVDFVSQLRGFGFQTVEDLAKMSDGSLHLFHGSMTWRAKAQRFLAQQKKAETAQSDQAKDQVIADLSARLAALEAKPKNKGGRPKKIEQPAA